MDNNILIPIMGIVTIIGGMLFLLIVSMLSATLCFAIIRYSWIFHKYVMNKIKDTD